MRLLHFWYNVHTEIPKYVRLVVTFALDLWSCTSLTICLACMPLCMIFWTLHQTVLR